MKDIKSHKEDSNTLLTDERKINIDANNNSSKYMYIYLLFLIFIEYIKNNNISYDLFSVFFVSQLIKSLYKYMKVKDNIYLIQCIGCAIAIIGLLILIVAN